MTPDQLKLVEGLDKYITQGTRSLEAAKNSLGDNSIDALVKLVRVMDFQCNIPDKIEKAERAERSSQSPDEQKQFADITGKLKTLQKQISEFMETNHDSIRKLLAEFHVLATGCVDDGTPAAQTMQNLRLHPGMAPITVGGRIGA